MRLSPHFTLSEMTKTSHPELQDLPTNEQIAHLVYLCATVLEPLREKIGRPLVVNSGYRSKALNKAVGGVANSYHLEGLAADLRCSNVGDAHVLLAHLKTIPCVDLALLERAGNAVWVHVQTSYTPRRRIVH